MLSKSSPSANNGFTIETSENEVARVMLSVAEGSIQEPELAIWLKKNSIPI
jgi:death-on-curing protein